jgi:GNAT superfamily N-acetyltransferase
VVHSAKPEEFTIGPARPSEVEALSALARRSKGFYSLAFGNRAALEHLWMDPRFMGRGLGRRLVEHAMSRTALRGYSNLQVDADPNAESFYVRMGGIRVGLVPAPVAGASRLLPRVVIPVFDEDA